MFELEQLELINESLSMRCRLLEDRHPKMRCLFSLSESMRKHVELFVLKNDIEKEIARLEHE